VSACSGQGRECYVQALKTTQAAYKQAQQDVASACGSGGDAATCNTAKSDAAQLYVNQKTLAQSVASMTDYNTPLSNALHTALLDGALLVGGALTVKLVSGIRSGLSAIGGATANAFEGAVESLTVGDEPYSGPSGTSDGGMAHPVGTNGAGSNVATATNTGVTSEGTANSATLQGLKGQLANENLANIAAQDPRLAAAVNGSGTSNLNFSIGSGTATDANQLGKIWVGDGATMMSDGSGLMSADGTRAYRFPTQKNSPYATTGTQANFEMYNVNAVTGQRVKVSNGHLNVTN